MQHPRQLDGVGASRIFLPTGSCPLLLDFLAGRFPKIGRDVWRQRLQDGKISDACGRRLSVDSPFIAGEVVHYYRELPDEMRIPFEAQILYRDDELLVADKPHFLPTMPAGRFVKESLLVRLKLETGLDHLVPLHRLDRVTAGVVLFSVNPKTRDTYSALFAERRIAKVYEALAASLPQTVFPVTRSSRIETGEPFFRMQEIEGVPNAHTTIERLAAHGDISRYRLRPLTGKKHQLRIHMAALGAAILNDRWYPQLLDDVDDDYSQPLKLLARSLSFDDPVTGQTRVFESRLNL